MKVTRQGKFVVKDGELVISGWSLQTSGTESFMDVLKWLIFQIPIRDQFFKEIATLFSTGKYRVTDVVATKDGNP